jgi:hypothetical protein
MGKESSTTEMMTTSKNAPAERTGVIRKKHGYATATATSYVFAVNSTWNVAWRLQFHPFRRQERHRGFLSSCCIGRLCLALRLRLVATALSSES